MAASSGERVHSQRFLQRRSSRNRCGPTLRGVAVAATVVALIGAAPAAAFAQSPRFPDVPADHYAFEAVEWAATVGVTTGYTDGTFKPQRPLSKRHAVVFMERYYDEILQAEESEDFTRGDMMVLLKAINDGTIDGTGSDTAAESPSGDAASPRFPDVPADHYAFEAVEWAATVGVTTGYTDGTFKPQRPLSKRHAVVFMERYYDEILQAEESEDFTRGDMMVLLKAINDGTIDGTGSDTEATSDEAGLGEGQQPSIAYIDVAVGAGHGCAVQVDGTIECWGEYYYEETGQYVAHTSLPDATFSSVSAGWSHICGLRTDGMAECWGANTHGQARPPRARIQFDAIDAGYQHSCALGTNGRITCWGGKGSGQAVSPRGGGFVAVDAGTWHTCGLRRDATILCWGDNGWGQSNAPQPGKFHWRRGRHDAVVRPARRRNGHLLGHQQPWWLHRPDRRTQRDLHLNPRR